MYNEQSVYEPVSPQVKLFGSYLGGVEAPEIVLLPDEPSDDAGGIAQVLIGWRVAEFSQDHVRADLHRQRG